jgi:hypothetical protein
VPADHPGHCSNGKASTYGESAVAFMAGSGRAEAQPRTEATPDAAVRVTSPDDQLPSNPEPAATSAGPTPVPLWRLDKVGGTMLADGSEAKVVTGLTTTSTPHSARPRLGNKATNQ